MPVHGFPSTPQGASSHLNWAAIRGCLMSTTLAILKTNSQLLTPSESQKAGEPSFQRLRSPAHPSDASGNQGQGLGTPHVLRTPQGQDDTRMSFKCHLDDSKSPDTSPKGRSLQQARTSNFPGFFLFLFACFLLLNRILKNYK